MFTAEKGDTPGGKDENHAQPPQSDASAVITPDLPEKNPEETDEVMEEKKAAGSPSVKKTVKKPEDLSKKSSAVPGWMKKRKGL